MQTTPAPKHEYAKCDYLATCYSDACAPVGWVIATILDQTWGYYNTDGGFWITHNNAVFFLDRATAKSVARHLDKAGHIDAHLRWVEPVTDELEFRTREDTW